ncbi:hypothetical protein EDC01DRAFT_635327 [Geopyxis carbonaria]|nr:hypothetical protein EDC01DRAFT_635327 [Geopyxis carbonaria]
MNRPVKDLVPENSVNDDDSSETRIKKSDSVDQTPLGKAPRTPKGGPSSTGVPAAVSTPANKIVTGSPFTRTFLTSFEIAKPEVRSSKTVDIKYGRFVVMFNGIWVQLTADLFVPGLPTSKPRFMVDAMSESETSTTINGGYINVSVTPKNVLITVVIEVPQLAETSPGVVVHEQQLSVTRTGKLLTSLTVKPYTSPTSLKREPHVQPPAESTPTHAPKKQDLQDNDVQHDAQPELRAESYGGPVYVVESEEYQVQRLETAEFDKHSPSPSQDLENDFVTRKQTQSGFQSNKLQAKDVNISEPEETADSASGLTRECQSLGTKRVGSPKEASKRKTSRNRTSSKPSSLSSTEQSSTMAKTHGPPPSSPKDKLPRQRRHRVELPSKSQNSGIEKEKEASINDDSVVQSEDNLVQDVPQGDAHFPVEMTDLSSLPTVETSIDFSSPQNSDVPGEAQIPAKVQTKFSIKMRSKKPQKPGLYSGIRRRDLKIVFPDLPSQDVPLVGKKSKSAFSVNDSPGPVSHGQQVSNILVSDSTAMTVSNPGYETSGAPTSISKLSGHNPGEHDFSFHVGDEIFEKTRDHDHPVITPNKCLVDVDATPVSERIPIHRTDGSPLEPATVQASSELVHNHSDKLENLVTQTVTRSENLGNNPKSVSHNTLALRDTGGATDTTIVRPAATVQVKQVGPLTISVTKDANKVLYSFDNKEELKQWLFNSKTGLSNPCDQSQTRALPEPSSSAPSLTTIAENVAENKRHAELARTCPPQGSFGGRIRSFSNAAEPEEWKYRPQKTIVEPVSQGIATTLFIAQGAEPPEDDTPEGAKQPEEDTTQGAEQPGDEGSSKESSALSSPPASDDSDSDDSSEYDQRKFELDYARRLGKALDETEYLFTDFGKKVY